MASKASAAIAIILSLNLLFFSMANADIVTLNECPNHDVNVCVGVLGLGGSLTGNGPCCSLLSNLVALDAEVCLCAIVNANILGIVVVDAPVQLNLLLNQCAIYPTKIYNCY
ncbi:Auxin-Induced in Root cultures 1 [Hibiscus trionum]|uniref:Auxin-Induced in Root cultures 1 n=1 Tax=Hibiscus trionum TaxID=183268 RepID=A0A9W7MH74_HIBTR|nr:Auxin-Induced in Root cultures 1 [Hibiscus trionum]